MHVLHIMINSTVPQKDVISPEIRHPPESAVVDLATSVKLTCMAEGHPAPTYEWYKDGVLIPGETISFLYIGETAPSDRGNYTCKATNSKAETDQSRPAKLDIQGRTILKPFYRYLAVLGSAKYIKY